MWISPWKFALCMTITARLKRLDELSCGFEPSRVSLRSEYIYIYRYIHTHHKMQKPADIYIFTRSYIVAQDLYTIYTTIRWCWSSRLLSLHGFGESGEVASPTWRLIDIRTVKCLQYRRLYLPPILWAINKRPLRMLQRRITAGCALCGGVTLSRTWD